MLKTSTGSSRTSSPRCAPLHFLVRSLPLVADFHSPHVSEINTFDGNHYHCVDCRRVYPCLLDALGRAAGRRRPPSGGPRACSSSDVGSRIDTGSRLTGVSAGVCDLHALTSYSTELPPSVRSSGISDFIGSNGDRPSQPKREPMRSISPLPPAPFGGARPNVCWPMAATAWIAGKGSNKTSHELNALLIGSRVP